MKLYLVTYTDAGEIATWRCRAHDAEHAEGRFWDSLDEFGGPEGIRIVSVSRIRPRRERIARFFRS